MPKPTVQRLDAIINFIRGGRMLFRKKPIINEAVQWTGDNLREIIDFTGLHPSAQKWTWEEYEEVVKREGKKSLPLKGH
jgi:hypothetical protein